MTTGVSPGDALAGFWIRAAAYLIDYIPVGMVAFVVNQSTSSGGVGNWVGLLLLAVYSVVTWSTLGGTLGQLASGIAVVDAGGGGRVSLGQATVRFVVLVFSILPLGAGVIWAAFDARHQGWHDKAAGTYVVRRR